MAPIRTEVKGVEYIIIIIYNMYDRVYWKIFSIWNKSIMGDFKIALHSSILSDVSNRNGCR